MPAAFQVEEPGLLAASKAARITILCNPNAPTGSLLPLELIERVARQTTGLVIVDEAYVDFSGVSALPILKNYANLIITRTFSKAFALAGFRLGYALMHPQLAAQIQQGLLPFNIDVAAIIAAAGLRDHPDIVPARVRLIIQARARWRAFGRGPASVPGRGSRAGRCRAGTRRLGGKRAPWV